MTKISASETALSTCTVPGLPPTLAKLFGNCPLHSREDAEVYDGLLASVAADIKPRDTVEWL